MEKTSQIKFIILSIFLTGTGVAAFFLVLDLLEPINQAIAANDWKFVTDHFADYGFWAPFFISLAQALLVLLTVFPGSPIQMIAGFSLGPLVGFIACIIGVFVGNFIVYLVVKKLGSKITPYVANKKDLDRVEQLSINENTRLSKTIILLYLLPVIPYGLIAFTIAKSKMKFIKYTFITTIGPIPSIILSIVFGSLIITANYILTISLFLLLVLLTIITARYYKQIINYFTKTPHKQTMEYFQTNVIKPKPMLYFFILSLIKIFIFPRVNLKTNASEFKKNYQHKPYLIIYNHPSKLDWAYTFIPLYPQKVNAIIAYYYFCYSKLGRILHNLGGFPKFLFQPDISSVKNIKKVIKWGNILGIAPEGRLSAYGMLESITPATCKLIKHLKVPVVLAKVDGAYLTYPKWSSSLRKGRVDVTFEEMFTVDELNNYSVEKIDKILFDKLYYDDFDWQEKNMVFFKGKKFAEGLEHILYICPVCHKEFTYQSKDNRIFCTACHAEVTLNNYYQFETENKLIPKNIRDWYLYQKEFEKKNIENPDYKLVSNVTLKLPDPFGKGFVVVGQGIATLTLEKITYIGTINSEEKEIDFMIQNVPAIPFGIKEDFEIYHHNTLYYFIPENIRECVKWSVVGELIYNKYVKENDLNE